jgi:hypothetical protein
MPRSSVKHGSLEHGLFSESELYNSVSRPMWSSAIDMLPVYVLRFALFRFVKGSRTVRVSYFEKGMTLTYGGLSEYHRSKTSMEVLGKVTEKTSWN